MKALKGILNVRIYSHMHNRCKADLKDKYNVIRDTDGLDNDQMDILSHEDSANKDLHGPTTSGDIGAYIHLILFFALDP